MRTLLQDLRFGARMLAKNRGFTAVAVLTLALAIGANSVMFGLVHTVLLRPLPYQEPERLVLVQQTSSDRGNPISISLPDYFDWREQSSAFESLAAFMDRDLNLTGSGRPERVRVKYVTANLFPTLGVQPALGRGFLPDDDRRGGPLAAVLSHDLWQSRFGGDPRIVETSVVLNDRNYTVVGVLPAGFQFYQPADMWLPLGTYVSNSDWTNRGNHPGLLSVGKLKPGTGIEHAQAEMDAICARLGQQYPDTNRGSGARVVPLGEDRVSGVRGALWTLLGAVGLVLLVGCANVANLLLARGAAREKEMAVRVALGAGRRQLVRQLLIESALLALMGAGAGLLLASVGIDAITKFRPRNIPRLDELRLSAPVVAFTFALSFVTTLVFGLIPALQASRTHPSDAMKDASHASPGKVRQRTSSALVVSEIALTLVLVTGAALLLRSFYRLYNDDLGFDARNVLSARVALPQVRYPETPSRINFFERTLAAVRNLPGVESAATITPLPLAGGWGKLISAEGQAPGEAAAADYAVVSTDYFRVMGIRLLRGRVFTESDRPGTPTVYVVDEALARRFWPDQDAIGKRVKVWRTPQGAGEWAPVVGVVRHVKSSGTLGRSGIQLYLPFQQTHDGLQAMTFALKTSVAPAALAEPLREAIQQFDKDLPVYDVRPLDSLVSASIAPQRLATALLGAFAALALALAGTGIYGVMAYFVARRTREIGIRIALGARPRDVLALVLRRGLRLAGAGVAVGFLVSLATARVLSTQLYGITPTDLPTFIAVPAFVLLVAILASYLPARPATRVDPMVALRYE